MTTEKLYEAQRLQENISKKERELRDLEEAIFNTRDLEDEYNFNSICYSSNQEFRFKTERIFISKTYIKNRLEKAQIVLEKELEELKTKFKEL